MNAKILAYDVEKFWGRFRDSAEYVLELLNLSESPLPLEPIIEDEITRALREPSPGDEANFSGDGGLLPVRVASDESSINVGKYEIAAVHFGRMSVYLARGGFLGWIERAPGYLQPTLDAIKKSEREFYRELRRELGVR